MSPTLDKPFSVVLEDETVIEGFLRKIDAGPDWAKHRVTIELDDDDTSGHALDALSVAVRVRFENDVEAHALSLHFPTAAKADEFKRRIVATGVVAGALVVGVTAAQLASSAPAAEVNPAAAPAPFVTSTGTRITEDPLGHIHRIAAPSTVEAIPGAQPKVNPRLPAEDLAPTTRTDPAEQPAINPRIPAEDLAPAPDSAPKLPGSHHTQD